MISCQSSLIFPIPRRLIGFSQGTQIRDRSFENAVPDGSGRVSHKLTSLNFEGFIMPQDDLNKRYFSDQFQR
jgi:hypothetical protein